MFPLTCTCGRNQRCQRNCGHSAVTMWCRVYRSFSLYTLSFPDSKHTIRASKFGLCGNPKRVAKLEMKILIRFFILSGRSLPGERPEIELLSRCIVDAVIATGLLGQPQLDHQDYVFYLCPAMHVTRKLEKPSFQLDSNP